MSRHNRPARRGRTPALDLSAWIRLAEERGLIATIDDFASLPKGEPVYIAPLEYSRFLLSEYPDRHPAPLPGSRLPPCEFFAPLRETFVRLEDVRDVPLLYHSRGRVVEGMRPQVVGRLTFPGGDVCDRAGIYSTRDTRHAESGSGDGYSRYILWSRLEEADMPLLFHTFHAFAAPRKQRARGSNI